MASLISIVVPCFNYGEYLGDCIESLQAQSHYLWECIIVDDGSTDRTPDVCAQLARSDGRISLFRQENRGLSAARNAGIHRARGEFVQLLDADDRLEAEKLKVQCEYLETHPETDIVIGEVAFFDGSAPANLRSRRLDGALESTRRVSGAGASVLGPLVSGNICVVNSALVRHAVFRSVGFFDERLRAHEDWDFWIRCALRDCQFAFVSQGKDRALVREHRASMSRGKELMFRTAKIVRERVQPRLSDELKVENSEQIAELTWRLGLELVRKGERKDGWALFHEGLRASSRKMRALSRLFLFVPGAPLLARLKRALAAAWHERVRE
jgi:glycosyltransferase involved in cell wall biosynthesis